MSFARKVTKDGEWRTLEDAKKCVIFFQIDFDIGQFEGHKTVKIIRMKNKMDDWRANKMSGANRRALSKESLKVVYNEKHGLSARCLMLVMSMGHWRSRFVFLLCRRLFFIVFPFPPSTSKLLCDFHVNM